MVIAVYCGRLQISAAIDFGTQFKKKIRDDNPYYHYTLGEKHKEIEIYKLKESE